MGFYDFDGFTSLLTRPDLSAEDRLMVCKTMADLCAMGDNAIKMSVCPGLPEALADVLSSTPGAPGGRTDERHQAFAALCVTRCVSKCSSETCTKWALTPGLVDGLNTLRKSEDKFLQVSALVALRMFVRCDDAVGSSRKLLRLKWRGALVESSSSSRSRSETGHGSSSASQPKPPHSTVDDAAQAAQRQNQNGSHIERVPDNAIQHHYHSHGGRAHMMPAAPGMSEMSEQHRMQGPPAPRTNEMSEQHRMQGPPASQGTASSTPFSSSRLGSVQRAQPQSVPASPHSMPQSVPQSPHMQPAGVQNMPVPSHQHRWMGDPSSAPSRPPPLAYSDFSSSKQDDFQSQGQDHDAMGWASARETKPNNNFPASENSSRSPYSSANSAYSAGPTPHNPHNLALGSMQNFALRGYGVQHG